MGNHRQLTKFAKRITKSQKFQADPKAQTFEESTTIVSLTRIGGNVKASNTELNEISMT